MAPVESTHINLLVFRGTLTPKTLINILIFINPWIQEDGY